MYNPYIITPLQKIIIENNLGKCVFFCKTKVSKLLGIHSRIKYC